mgnify:CR=1 FL=1
MFGEMADALVHAGEERVRPSVLQRLSEHAQLNKRQTEAALRAWTTVAADPAGASVAALDELAGLLRPEQVRSFLTERRLKEYPSGCRQLLPGLCYLFSGF